MPTGAGAGVSPGSVGAGGRAGAAGTGTDTERVGRDSTGAAPVLGTTGLVGSGRADAGAAGGGLRGEGEEEEEDPNLPLHR